MRRVALVLGIGVVAALAWGCGEDGAPPGNAGGAGQAGADAQAGAGSIGDAGGVGAGGTGAAGEGGVSVVNGGAAGSSDGGVGGSAGAAATCEPLPEVAAPVFEQLGDLMPVVNPMGYETVPEALSINGRVVVGASSIGDERHAYAWTHDAGLKDLSSNAAGFVNAIGTSCDGSVLIATDEQGDTFRLAQGAAPLLLVPGTPGATGVWIRAVDASGHVSVGASGEGDADANAEQWVGSNAKGIPLGVHGYATDVSADGRVIVGVRYVGADVANIFRWTAAGGAEILLAATNRMAQVSADGSSIIAHHPDGTPFRWRREGVTELPCPTGQSGCTAQLINRDGSVIVLSGPAPDYQSLIWTETEAAVSFTNTVVEAGAMLGSWTSLNVVDMSADALVFTGLALGAGDETATYRLQIPLGTF